jgi:hypothetical protein
VTGEAARGSSHFRALGHLKIVASRLTKVYGDPPAHR